MIRLASPWLFAAAAPLALYALWRLRLLPPIFGRRRRAIQVVMGVAIVAAALAVGGLELGRRVDRLAVVFAIDRSRSVDATGDDAVGEDAIRRAIGDAAATQRGGDQVGVVVFAAGAATESLPAPGAPVARSVATLPRDATDLGAGIRRALSDLPSEHTGRVVVVSDGVENRGDALAAAALAAGRGVVVDVWPIERAPSAEVAVETVRVPQTARPGEPIEVRVVTRATGDTPSRVRILRDGEAFAEATTVVRAGTDLLVLRDEAREPGVHRYDVLVTPLESGHDSGRENNEAGAFMRVVGGSRVLVAAGEPDTATGLVSAITREEVSVDLVGPRGLPIDLGELASYDLVILADLNARSFTEDQMEALRSYVRDLGGGLLMAGARDSFGLGGYTGTPVEDALPARFDLRRRRDRLSLGMVIAIDKSGSMTMEATPGRTKLDLANEAAARSAMLLSPSDRVGVMHVDTDVTWTQPMVEVANPGEIAARCRAAQPGGGGIFVNVTMDATYAVLRAERTQLKHFLLFSDGQDSEEMQGTREMVRLAFRDGITTSVVSMGHGPDTPELEALSRLGGGRFYIVEDLTRLPSIFTQETIEASRAGLMEEPFEALLGAPGGATRGIDFGGAPALLGHAVVNARPRASVLLGATEEDPLLATWQHGVGRSAVFTTDLGHEFGRPWLGWPGYRVLFDQLARDLARAPEQRDAQVSLTIENGVGRVRVEAVSEDGRYRNYLDMDATVALPGGDRGEVALRQTGPGRYEGTFDADAPGPYLVSVREDERGLVGSAGMVRPSGDELRGDGTNHALLGQIAALTGGVVRTDLSGVFTERPPATWAHDPLWPALLIFTLCALLLSVAMRRLVLPPMFRRRAKATSRPDARRPATPAASGAPSTRPALGSAPGRGPVPTRDADPSDAEDRETPPEEPASLAEELLSRKRKRRR